MKIERDGRPSRDRSVVFGVPWFQKIEGPEPWQGGNLWLDLKLAAFGTR